MNNESTFTIDQSTARKSLQEMNLIDDFLFTSMMSYPEICERFSRLLVKIILNYDVKNVRVTPQKVFYGSNTNTHGARLDVYIEEDVDELKVLEKSLFDIETEKKNDKILIEALPRRVRFYHSKIDNISLASGDGYEKLKKVYVIMIMPFDPFGENHMIYTIRSRCEELPDMPYDDGSRTIFLYTRGKLGNTPQQLRELLEYMEQTVDLLRKYLDYLPPELKNEEVVTSSAINNYVRRGIMPGPIKKKYYRPHIACLLMICTLKQSLNMSMIKIALPTCECSADARCDECAKSPVGSAENSCTSGVRSAYESFISRHDLTAKYFVQQVRLASAALLDHDEKPDIAVQTTEELVASAAIVAGFSRLLAEKLLLLDGKDLSNGGSIDCETDSEPVDAGE